MTIETFWDILQETKKKSKSNEEHMKLIEQKLSTVSNSELIDYHNHMMRLHDKAYTVKLWHASEIMVEFGCRDDCFTDFRHWLIAQGEEVYTKAINDPDSLATVNFDRSQPLQGYQYIPREVYEQRTNEEIPWEYIAVNNIDEMESPELADLEKILPRLIDKYGRPLTLQELYDKYLKSKDNI